MMLGNEDLGLSLSLTNFPLNQHSLQNYSTNSCSFPFGLTLPKPSWINSSSPSNHSPKSFRAETGSFFRGIDMNIPPSNVDCEEEAGVSSPKSTMSSVSGKRSEREVNGDGLEIERAYSRGNSDEEDGENSRKKRRLTKEQSAILEDNFKEHSTLNTNQKSALAEKLGLRARQVEVWFQNRRARTKLKQTEVDCEFLKRCCDNLTENNRRLQKEVHELRALKLSSTQFYMQMTPPTTLTMCTSCERVPVPPHLPSTSTVDQRTHRLVHMPIPINPWAQAAPITAHRRFDALRP